ncbi:MAG: arginine--tRNA ligase [Candidatus Schekmanbacteria bacterium RIFCSPHIGHO2_02_FULL_38_11]|uniref:Arginine--tRNA ligase n=1 Tax=Candidatus Schekmanbacteria bacterium RIFCSPLOWO2_12_FULL_38_15 TaxID=1817883 RepID=A0A1F7SLR6_9BACT|nr:MAG: arginine--tRNA ligase [Candidatus Schekmanbacteria bacterium RIFCSPLOWO2_02_FULL_38_14]OGL49945.1 MAG: arginine--tRNA ligase [Candidatus Schekmanbacteria bacterium RIFCSPHIGHO2_02_FULL_38_11]OGL54147.1 MAG: arginine--tRNA ligase [Candidatus Schekmanbacteria bacterium RIFCSPLOWO2_12_FULL_38_15]
MSTLKKTLKQAIMEAIEVFKKELGQEEFPPLIIEIPKDAKFGHFSTNIALALSSKLNKPPRKIAEEVLNKFSCPVVEKTEIAGAGFINFFITEKAWQKLIPEVILNGEKFGSSNIGNNERIQIEFVSANPTGPLHIGHGRGAAVGDVLANTLEFAGFNVEREYYINDVGIQMANIGKTLKARYLELLGKETKFPENGYPGAYVREIAEKFKIQNSKFKIQNDDDLQFFSDFAGEKILGGIKKDLESFRVRFDKWFSEKSLFESGEVKNSIELLKKNGFIFEKEGAWWLKASDFEDEKDRVVIKTDGSTTYLASDIAYHKNKLERGYKKLVNIWGADHHGYIPRMKTVVRLLGYPEEMLAVILVQMVNLQKHGKPVAMGKREGEFVTLREVMDEVGVDACRFFFLERKSNAHLNFDLALAKEQSNKNPVYYVQYAHARICSIFSKAEEKGITLPEIDKTDFSLLNTEEELSIMRKIYQFQEIIEVIANTCEPHHLTFYLKELVALFHKYYNEHPILGDESRLTDSRLALCMAIRIVLRNGMRLLGISAPERM